MSDDNAIYSTTENGANALQTSGNCFVDFFMMFVRNIDINLIEEYMDQCWKIDPKKTVAIILHARDRMNGKKEKNISNRAMIWMRKYMYNTYKLNITNYINKYGCWKDLMYICLKCPKYHELEIEIITEQLKKDKENLEKGLPVSLCGKWVSSEKDKYDDKLKLAHEIAKSLFKDDDKMMERYRKEYLVPLRKQIDIVESYMTSNKWTEIKYDQVPAVATKRLRNAFTKHDPEGYARYLEMVAIGTKKIKIAGILPHELVNYYLKNDKYDETIELQWKELVNNVKEQGILDNIIPVVDVSGSMFTCDNVQPIQVSIALGLLISECTSGFFANKMISFHDSPVICKLSGDTLQEKVRKIKEIPAGTSTNFEAVFDLLINSGKMFDIDNEQMPKKIIVLSDMQFDEASANNEITENTLHEIIVSKYENTDYTPPKFIYWNLSPRYNGTFPVKAINDNIAMISGFSEQLLKVFMNNDDFNPVNIVYDILSKYEPDVIIHQFDM